MLCNQCNIARIYTWCKKLVITYYLRCGLTKSQKLHIYFFMEIRGCGIKLLINPYPKMFFDWTNMWNGEDWYNNGACVKN